jgi:hypothetical protein
MTYLIVVSLILSLCLEFPVKAKRRIKLPPDIVLDIGRPTKDIFAIDVSEENPILKYKTLLIKIRGKNEKRMDYVDLYFPREMLQFVRSYDRGSVQYYSPDLHGQLRRIKNDSKVSRLFTLIDKISYFVNGGIEIDHEETAREVKEIFDSWTPTKPKESPAVIEILRLPRFSLFVEPTPGVEPGTSALRKHCSAIELGRQFQKNTRHWPLSAGGGSSSGGSYIGNVIGFSIGTGQAKTLFPIYIKIVRFLSTNRNPVPNRAATLVRDSASASWRRARTAQSFLGSIEDPRKL